MYAKYGGKYTHISYIHQKVHTTKKKHNNVQKKKKNVCNEAQQQYNECERTPPRVSIPIREAKSDPPGGPPVVPRWFPGGPPVVPGGPPVVPGGPPGGSDAFPRP